ncbi:conserved hypothetical protein, partial [Ricinus communis]
MHARIHSIHVLRRQTARVVIGDDLRIDTSAGRDGRLRRRHRRDRRLCRRARAHDCRIEPVRCSARKRLLLRLRRRICLRRICSAVTRVMRHHAIRVRARLAAPV